MTLIVEDLLLLLLDDKSGKALVDSTKLPRVLAGALVVELATTGALRLTGPGETIRKNHLAAAGSAPADPLLRRAFDTITLPSKPGRTHRPMKPKAAIEKLHRKLTVEVAARLDKLGYVTETRTTSLGLFPTIRWPARDTLHKNKIRSALRSALVDGTTPTPHSAALISLTSAVDATHKVISDADKKSLKRRAKEIAEGEWAGEAVRKAVQDINTAVMAAVMVPAIAAAGSG